MMQTPTRREILKLSPLVLGATTLAVRPLEATTITHDVSPLSDFRFKCAFQRAMWRLRLQGKLPRRKFCEIRAAVFSSFKYTDGEYDGTFIQHTQREVEQDAQACGVVLATAAGIFLEALILWIMENWNKILIFVIRNLKNMEVALDESAP